MGAPSFQTLWDPMDWAPPPPTLLCPWDFLSKSTGVGSHAFLKGIFPTQGSNPCFLHCRWILYHWGTGEVWELSVKAKCGDSRACAKDILRLTPLNLPSDKTLWLPLLGTNLWGQSETLLISFALSVISDVFVLLYNFSKAPFSLH